MEWITLGAENSLAHQKHQIQTAFGITPVQHYGMEEGVANISEHPDHTLRIDEDFAAVELVPSDMPGLCKVVGTNFSNPAFPLLRYNVGDLVSANESPARSGAFRRIIRTLDGRTEAKLRQGAAIHLGAGTRMDIKYLDTLVKTRNRKIDRSSPELAASID
ncbi:MAG: hypothetical protein WBG82_05715 [Parvibaculum sp.]|uniref:hypothetical protein n=1 Tax=Parvibaculum sp. TaxID=2024848 RepID=UPI003C7208CA